MWKLYYSLLKILLAAVASTLLCLYSGQAMSQEGGTFYTPEDLALWQERSVNGPFKSAGDAFTSSPGEWDRLKELAEDLLNVKDDMLFEGLGEPLSSENAETYNNPEIYEMYFSPTGNLCGFTDNNRVLHHGPLGKIPGALFMYAKQEKAND